MKKSTLRPGAWQNMALPMVLIATGLILLGGDYLGILSLDRIQNFWPVAVIAIGLVELIPMDSERESQLARALQEQEKGNHARQL
ncbi:MAG: LiaI-LiaF-like domain-containing protein [Bryobacteraceae bacterium]